LNLDKATLDVPSPLAGRSSRSHRQVATKVSEGTPIARVDGSTAAKAAPRGAGERRSPPPPT
jgi:pyruvate/2-oxoglutarate dehydrogenase complex dihydrolipoamide acyltransferase (E2) component